MKGVITYALTIFYAQQDDWPHAFATADRLAALSPDDPQVRAFVADVRRRARLSKPPAGARAKGDD